MPSIAQTPFIALCILLRSVQQNLDNFELVQELNLAILKQIVRAERAIQRQRETLRQLRSELKSGRKVKSETAKIRRRITLSQYRIDLLAKQIFIWKCFGDGLAFSYLDKFSVKHAFFETETLNVKPNAGMIIGKDGIANELACLVAAIRHKVPAVLCDLTNVIRYGDVCLLGASDPHLIEVKATRRLNQRGKRQSLALQRLTEFLEKDGADNFRGMANVRRYTVHAPERNYMEELNKCIDEAEKTGHAVAHPEAGLTYLVVYGVLNKPVESILPPKASGMPIFFMLNSEKNDRTWGMYYPFTLSIRKPEHLYDFVVGRLSLVVMFDLDALRHLLEQQGFEVNFRVDANYGVQCRHKQTDIRANLSMQFLGRIGYEFVSPAWIAENLLHSMRKVIEGATSTDAAVLSPEDQKGMTPKF